MSHFYGLIQGSRGQATRCGPKSSGVNATAAGWSGAITVNVSQIDGVDGFEVWLKPWQGSGGAAQRIAFGPLDSNRTYMRPCEVSKIDDADCVTVPDDEYTSPDAWAAGSQELLKMSRSQD